MFNKLLLNGHHVLDTAVGSQQEEGSFSGACILVERDRQSKASKKPTQSHESEVSAQKGIVEQNSIYWGEIQRGQLCDFEGEQGMRQGC